MAKYRSRSPTQSSDSVSDNEDEDYNKSIFFAPTEAVPVSPAQWSSRMHLLPHAVKETPQSPASRLPPELLIHILKHLHSARDLYSALLVSRAWCECSVELLWHRPTFSKLSTLVKMMRVLAKEDQTFLYAQFIRRLNFLYLGENLTDSLISRLAPCVRLERLTLINCSSISDEGLMRVLPRCPNLVALDLTGVNEVTDRSIVALAAACKRLQGINLGGCKKLTDKGILALAENCPLLRRVKLSSVELITDEPVSALAKSCPLLLEIDLNNCNRITDVSIRDIWSYSTQMRELRLSHCSELTDFAFPAPPRSELVPPGANPFPSSNLILSDKLPPLRLSGTFEHLRMLDLTACSALTDDAIEGIISVAPKIRNLVLAKCTQLTDIAVDNICKLGKNLHYLHLGHASTISDRSVSNLARSCTRLRYIDLANCPQLTDISVFELANLQKLRRIGLVRVNNLTDQAIYALAERHATLERIHLSYCDQVTVLAIHFLLQRLPKLTHLSLTGIPAFRRPELQQFCREPPQDFNTTQRAAFCVYSGKGVAELREFLHTLFNAITDDSGDDGHPPHETDYEQEFEDRFQQQFVDDMDTGDDEREDEDAYGLRPTPAPGHDTRMSLGRHEPPNGRLNYTDSYVQDTIIRSHDASMRELAMTRGSGDHATSPTTITHTWLNGQASSSAYAGPSRRSRGFGQQPIVETSTSPTPSIHSNGTDNSTTTTFFRTSTDSAATATPRNGVITPDLLFAEIGHGRGTGPGPTTVLFQGQSRLMADLGGDPNGAVHVHGVLSSAPSAYPVSPSPTAHSFTGTSSYVVSSIPPFVGPRTQHTSAETQTDHVFSLHDPLISANVADPHNTFAFVHRGRTAHVSPIARELHDSVQTALAGQSRSFDDREVDPRGRSVRRSLKNTLTAAEHYASSFFFGGRGGGSPHDGGAGPASSRDGDLHGY
ncbi:RNI-like protein [Obba rivulosa]|uniref:RNI-like protein n=1 Tax=Obba rivulosa TaxID=1052685 RepID=A0A8E2B5B7_9APHY|nr:RNI-like protein [Obba rivulosa]